VKIASGIEPCEHRSPYPRIDVRYPGRRKVVTRADVDRSGGREPDPAVYLFNYMLDCWMLKDGM
jgi:hypothetical protein